MTLPEVLLWQQLRGATPRFRRQHPFGAYVLDFYCAVAKLAVEVDGAAHEMGDRPGRDERRDVWLAAHQVLRIPAAEVLRDPVAVAEALRRHAAERVAAPPPSASPPPPRKRGRNLILILARLLRGSPGAPEPDAMNTLTLLPSP